MSAFYMPVGPASRGLRQIWCRCDECKYSGPMDQFAFYNLDAATVELCAACDQVQNAWMQVEGWVRR